MRGGEGAGSGRVGLGRGLAGCWGEGAGSEGGMGGGLVLLWPLLSCALCCCR